MILLLPPKNRSILKDSKLVVTRFGKIILTASNLILNTKTFGVTERYKWQHFVERSIFIIDVDNIFMFLPFAIKCRYWIVKISTMIGRIVYSVKLNPKKKQMYVYTIIYRIYNIILFIQMF